MLAVEDRKAEAARDSVTPAPAHADAKVVGGEPDPRAIADQLASLAPQEREPALAALHGTAGNHAVSQALALLSQTAQAQGQQGRAQAQAKTASSGTLASKADAIAFHEKAQALLAKVVEKGLRSKQAQLRNTCEWIQKQLCTTIVLTPTHDAAARALALSPDTTGGEALFGRDTAYPARGGDYTAKLEDAAGDPGVGVYDSDFEGWMTEGMLLLVVKPGMTAERLEGILMHEVQHQADQSKQGEPGRVYTDYGSDEDAHNSYRSEFRAYWVGDGGPGSKNDPWGSASEPAEDFSISAEVDCEVVTLPTKLKNQRQERILRHLVADYSWVATNYVSDPAFQKMVDGFSLPVGVNLVNSVRIQTLTDAIGMVDPESKRSKNEAQAIRDGMEALDDDDRTFLGDRKQSKPFWDHAREHLTSDECAELARTVKG